MIVDNIDQESVICGRQDGQMVSTLDSRLSGLSGLGLSPGWGHHVVFLGFVD